MQYFSQNDKVLKLDIKSWDNLAIGKSTSNPGQYEELTFTFVWLRVAPWICRITLISPPGQTMSARRVRKTSKHSNTLALHQPNIHEVNIFTNWSAAKGCEEQQKNENFLTRCKCLVSWYPLWALSPWIQSTLRSRMQSKWCNTAQ